MFCHSSHLVTLNVRAEAMFRAVVTGSVVPLTPFWDLSGHDPHGGPGFVSPGEAGDAVVVSVPWGCCRSFSHPFTPC